MKAFKLRNAATCYSFLVTVASGGRPVDTLQEYTG